MSELEQLNQWAEGPQHTKGNSKVYAGAAVASTAIVGGLFLYMHYKTKNKPTGANKPSSKVEKRIGMK